MSQVRVGLASAVLCLALVAPAGAQSTGNGLYEPFPAVAAKKRAKRFVNELPARARGVSDAELEHGSFAGSVLRPAPAGAASARATSVAAPSGTVGWLPALALLAVCTVPLLRAASGRRA
jgi:hypothetical protein